MKNTREVFGKISQLLEKKCVFLQRLCLNEAMILFYLSNISVMSQPYQKTYSQEAIHELVLWFRERFDRLPQSLQLRPGVVIPDLRVMVRAYLDVVQMHYENPTYGGQVHHLFEVRECLLNEGFA